MGKSGELLKRVWYEIGDDRCLGRAAELTYYWVLSLFPLLIFLLSVLSFVPKANEMLLNYMAQLMPPAAVTLVQDWARDLLKSRSGGILSFGLFFTLWSASTGMVALIDALNAAYEVPEERPFWKKRLIAIGLVFVLALLILGGASVIVFGDDVVAWTVETFDLPELQAALFDSLTYLIGLIMLMAGISGMYNFAPNIDYPIRWFSPGSAFTTISSILVSWGFSEYLKVGPSYSVTYGSLSAFIVLMLWLYLMSLIILIGAEINSELQKLNLSAAKAIRAEQL